MLLDAVLDDDERKSIEKRHGRRFRGETRMIRGRRAWNW